jgi:hypothetical protein
LKTQPIVKSACSRRWLKGRTLTTFMAALLLSTASAEAQVNVGRISGTVADSSGAALPGVTVTANEKSTGLSRTTVTDSKGSYALNALPIGQYTVTAELQGFKKLAKAGYDVVADGRVTVNLALELGAMTETVEVMAKGGETVNTTSGEIARVIDAEQVATVGLNGRNYLELATLIPGSPVLDDDSIAKMVGLGINTVINGGRSNTSSLNVDGQYNMVAGSNASQITNVGVDFIQEVTMKTSNFSAEYGRQSGANVNVTTKSGSNKFHGGARAYLRDESLDANNTFLNRRNLPPPPLKYHNFGWNVGGPIRKGKLFFFAGQEWKQVDSFTDAIGRTLPTSAELQGNFTARGSFLKDPLKTGTCSATVQTACFDNPRVIPANRITADGRAIAALFARMQKEARSFTDTPTANNGLFQAANPFDNRQDIIRIDYEMSNAHRIYGRAIFEKNEIIAPYGTFIDSQLPTTPNLRHRPGRNILIGHTWRASSTLINEFKAGASWNSQRMFAQGDIWKRETYGFQFPQVYLNGSRYEEATPRIAVNGFATAESMTRSLISPTTDISVSDTVTFTKAAHTVKAGLLYFRDRVDQNGRTNHAGDVVFNATGNPNSTGNAFADALLGNFRTYSEAELDPVGFFRFSQLDGFVGDNWRVNRNLSVDVGLRVQWHQPIYTQANNMVAFVPTAFNRAQAVTISPTTGLIVGNTGNRYNGLVRVGDGVPDSEVARIANALSPRVVSVPTGAPRGHYDPRTNFMPRFSFAYAPGGTDKMSIRGGIGVFYDRPEGNIVFTTLNSPPFSENTIRENANLANPLSGTAAATGPWGTIEAIDPNFQVPRITNWSLSVQRELFSGVFAELAYVGAAGRNLYRRPDINAIPPDALRASRALPTAQRPNDNSLRPYPGFTQILMHLSDAKSDYKALQVFLSKRRGAVTATVAYTLGKSEANAFARGDASTEAGEDVFEGLQDPLNYGPTSADRRHILAVTYGYKLPFFRDSAGIAKSLFAGWELNGTTNYQSGAPFTPLASTALGTRRADYLGGDVSLDDATFERWFNTAAFAAPPEDRKGNARIGMIRGPWFKRWNLTARKRTTIAKDVRLTLEISAFNLLNQVNYKVSGDGFRTVGNTAMGILNAASPPRTIQIGAQFHF